MPDPSPSPSQLQTLPLPALGEARRWNRLGDRLFRLSIWLCAALAGTITLLIFTYLAAQSVPFLAEVGLSRVVFDARWSPSAGQFQLLPMFVGTLCVTIGAVWCATPLGIACAVFMSFYAPISIARVMGWVLKLLAGIPSVVYGLWGLIVLVPLLSRWQPPGFSILLGIVILTIMVLPTVAVLSRAALAGVPREYQLGAFALGCDRWQVIWNVILPAARCGLTTATILATARVIGETMAVSMVMGNTIQIPDSILDPARTLTAHIALEMAFALGNHRAALFVAGLLLLVGVSGLVAIAEWLYRHDVALASKVKQTG